MFLYNVFILPLIYLLEVIIFALKNVLVLNPILAILFISFIVNMLSYPIFAKIENMCQKDNEDYQKLLPRINSIKKNFKGSEKRMLLETYFRQNHYHPLLAHFKQSLTIFLQVPIFIASYIVICHNALFHSDVLTAINEYFTFGAFSVRLLPILMTLINLASVRVYMQNKSSASKMYAYVLAGIFLVLLYFSPASIVMYWLFNNTFACLRNIYFYQKKRFKYWLGSFCAVCIGLAFAIKCDVDTAYALGFLCLFPILYKSILWFNKDMGRICAAIMFGIVYFVMYGLDFILLKDDLLVWIGTGLIIETAILCYRLLIKESDFKPSMINCAFYLFLPAVLLSVYLPFKLVRSDFLDFYAMMNPWDLLVSEFEIGLGFFVVYPLLVFYVQKAYRKALCFGYLVVFLIYFICFNTLSLSADTVDIYMHFNVTKDFVSKSAILKDVGYIMLLIIGVSLLVHKRMIKYINLFGVALMCVYGFYIASDFLYVKTQFKYVDQKDEVFPNLNISTINKNVVILFIDRAISGFVPQIMEEKPELKSVFSGFVYYPYTVSFGTQTLYSSPSLLGGYAYTPLKLQNDMTRKMVDKHNEAITLMPEAFRKSGYDVTLVDMPYINYEDKEAARFFDKDILLYNSAGRKVVSSEKMSTHIQKKSQTQIFWFGMFKALPTIYRDFIYNKGQYVWSVTTPNDDETLRLYAQRDYEKMEKLINNLRFDAKSKGAFLTFISVLTHSPTQLSKNYDFSNDKEPAVCLKTDDYCKHYNVNMLAYMEIAKLITKLKENHAYDNTKIVIVSDHGWPIEDIEHVSKTIVSNNAVLMVKDFNANGDFKTDTSFMTTADTPYIACDNAVLDNDNPFALEDAIKEKEGGVEIIAHRFAKCSPAHFANKDKITFYEEDAKYTHIDENNIKTLIKLKEEHAI